MNRGEGFIWNFQVLWTSSNIRKHLWVTKLKQIHYAQTKILLLFFSLVAQFNEVHTALNKSKLRFFTPANQQSGSAFTYVPLSLDGGGYTIFKSACILLYFLIKVKAALCFEWQIQFHSRLPLSARAPRTDQTLSKLDLE